MPISPVTPVFRDAAHRRAVMQGLASSIVPTALVFGFLAPVIGLLLTGGGQLVLLVSAVTSGEVHFFDAVAIASMAVLNAWLVAGLAAAIAGVWVAVLSPFAPNKLQFYAGAVAIGVMTAGLFLLPLPTDAAIAAGPLFPAAGAVAIAACTRICTNWPLGRGEDGRRAQRDRVAKARAERLAKERAGAA
jgi:hypothetical protein